MEETNQPIVINNITQPELPFWKNPKILERIILYTAILLLCIYGVNSCNDTSRLEGEYAILKDNKEKLEAAFIYNETEFAKERDSLHKENEASKKIIDEKEVSIKDAYKEIERLKRQKSKDTQVISTLPKKELASWFGERYNRASESLATENGITLNSNLPNLVAEELIERDYFEKEIVIKNTIINDKDNQLVEKDKIIENNNTEIEGLGTLLQEAKDINSLQDKENKKLEKQVSRLKTKNTLLNVGVPAGILIGVAAGFLIAN